MSHVTCHMSHIICHYLFIYFFDKSGEASPWRVCYQRSLPRLVLRVFPLLLSLLQKRNLLLKYVERKLSCSSEKVPPGSSEEITHRIGKHWEVQKPLLVSLHADICQLRPLISSSTKYLLCPVPCPVVLLTLAFVLIYKHLACSAILIQQIKF